MDKCFCHLNGYKVKDSDARKSIEELRQQMGEVNSEALSEEIEDRKNADNELSEKIDTIDKKVDNATVLITPQMYGAIGDGETNDTEAFQRMVSENQGKHLYIPSGIYRISDTILLDNGTTIEGAGTINSRILMAKGVDKPIFSVVEHASHLGHITIKNLGLYTYGERTNYSIVFRNVYKTTLDNVAITGEEIVSPLDKHGLHIYKDSGYNGMTFVTEIKNCCFTRASIYLISTDSYISNNEIWGEQQQYTIKLEDCHNTIIESNQFVGGSTYGALYLPTNGRHLRIVDNYFDGSYNELDTRYAIHAENGLESSVISNNNFWKQKRGAIRLGNAQKNVISNNLFYENDYYNTNDPEINIIHDSTIGYSFANIITGNSFYREKYIDKLEGYATKTRPTETPAPIMVLFNTSGYPQTLITNNACTFRQFYGAIVTNEDGYFKSINNNMDLFNVNYKYSYAFTQHFEPFEKEGSLGKMLCIKNPAGEEKRVDNLPVIISDTLNKNNDPFNFDKVYKGDYCVFVNDYKTALNNPAFAPTGNKLVSYKEYANNYGIQFVISYGSPKKLGIRSLENGTWSAFTVFEQPTPVDEPSEQEE